MGCIYLVILLVPEVVHPGIVTGAGAVVTDKQHFKANPVRHHRHDSFPGFPSNSTEYRRQEYTVCQISFPQCYFQVRWFVVY
jgi:hypothetical protein